MDTQLYNSPDFFTDGLPDPIEMLYKTQFNQAWGTRAKNDPEAGEGALRPVDSAHQRAVAEVEKHYMKTSGGHWVSKPHQDIACR